MIRTSVIPCLSVAWLKITKLCPYLSYFPGFLAILKVCFFSKIEGQSLHQSSQTGCFSQMYNNQVTIFQKKHDYVD